MGRRMVPYTSLFLFVLDAGAAYAMPRFAQHVAGLRATVSASGERAKMLAKENRLDEAAEELSHASRGANLRERLHLAEHAQRSIVPRLSTHMMGSYWRPREIRRILKSYRLLAAGHLLSGTAHRNFAQWEAHVVSSSINRARSLTSEGEFEKAFESLLIAVDFGAPRSTALAETTDHFVARSLDTAAHRASGSGPLSDGVYRAIRTLIFNARTAAIAAHRPFDHARANRLLGEIETRNFTP